MKKSEEVWWIKAIGKWKTERIEKNDAQKEKKNQ